MFILTHYFIFVILAVFLLLQYNTDSLWNLHYFAKIYSYSEQNAQHFVTPLNSCKNIKRKVYTMNTAVEKSILLKNLQESVSVAEYRQLQLDAVPHISKYNRRTILELMARENAPEGEVPSEKVDALRITLENYLGIYLADQKESWKWIILPCLYLCFICGRPLHPQEVVHYTETTENGNPIYRCPMREEGVRSVCRFCVCKKS